MEYDVAPEERERSIKINQQKYSSITAAYQLQQQHQYNFAALGENMKSTITATPTITNEIAAITTTAFQPNQYATNSSSKLTSGAITVTKIRTISTSVPAPELQINSSSAVMEAATTHINLIDDEEEKDPLALDSSLELQQAELEQKTVKHSHSLRRHVPRIIVKPILPEKKITTITASNAVSATEAPITASSSISPSSRGSSSRRIQQQQQAKAAAAAAAAAAALTTSSLTTATLSSTTAITQASTMREVLASIPGFSLKPRRRSSKKMSTAAQIEQTKDGKIDLETPDSILASTNLRALLNKQTFSMLPPLYQYNLIQLLPSVDREAIEMERKQNSSCTVPMEAIRLGTSNLNNEFFARACLEWRERLSEGEFTPENQVKLKTEAEREKNKLDPWKLKHFEPIWGEKAANRACSSSSASNSSISSNKSSIVDSCNMTITNHTCSSSSSSSTGNNKNLAERKLEFKLESKGALTATIVKAPNVATTTLNIKEISSALETKEQEKKSIIEFRLDQNQKTVTAEVANETKQAIVMKQESDENVNLASSEQQKFSSEGDKSRQLPQEQTKDEFICDKQTETYVKLNATADSNRVAVNLVAPDEQLSKIEPPSVFDQLRMQGNVYEHEAKLKKRGLKRSSDSISANSTIFAAGTDVDSDNNRQQPQDDEVSGSHKIESKQLKIEIVNENVPKQNKTFVSCAASVFEAKSFQASSTSSIASSNELEQVTAVTEQVVDDVETSCQIVVPPINNATSSLTQEIIDNYAVVEQQIHLQQFLQKQQEQQKFKTQQQMISKEPELDLSSTCSATKLQYFAQIQPATTTAQNIININSTCDSIKDTFNAATAATFAATSEPQAHGLQQQINVALNESTPSTGNVVGEAVDLIEQNFADAENYVLQSGDVSTDSGDTVTVQNSSTLNTVAGVSNKNNLTEGDFVFSSSLDHVIGSDACDNLYDNNKTMLPTSVSSATTSSSSSSSSSSASSSSPTTSSAVTTSDMQEILSAANSLSNTLFNTPPQPQQPRPHQDDHQQQQQQQSHIMSRSSRHNEMFQHVQHDWNFGVLKMQQNNADAYLNARHEQSTEQCNQQQHVLQQAAIAQAEGEPNGDNDVVEEINECAMPSLVISNDVVVAHHVNDDERDDDDDDEMDDSDAVRDIVDELQQQHQQLLQEQQQHQEQQIQQLQAQEHHRQLEQQQPQFAADQLEYSNEMSESLSSEVICDVPMSAAEMEVTSTVVTNSNSNDDSSNELNLFNSNAIAANISNAATMNHHQPQLPHQSAQTPQQQQQRQMLVDSNGQIIRNFFVQQQQLQQQQQLLHQAQQLAAFQTNQHHQPVSTLPQQQQAQQQLLQHMQPQPQHKAPTLSMQVIRRPYDNNANGQQQQQQLFQHAVVGSQSQQQQHQIEQSNQQQQMQHFTLQQRNYLPQATNTVAQASTSNNLMPSQQIQLQTQHQTQPHQHQQMPTFQTQQTQPHPKFLSKHLNIISMPRSSVNITSSSAAATPSAATAFSTYSTSPALNAAALPTAATAIVNNSTLQQLAASSNTGGTTIKTLPPAPPAPVAAGIPSTIAQQRLIMTKMPSGKGRKATNNKLPPGAVNLERSYQICQAVIQNSPNRESLKAQLRPPSAILGQQQQSSGGSSPSSAASLSNSCSSASSSPSSSAAILVKNEDIIATSTTMPTGMPPNVMGVGRPNVYKVIGPRMGFPRKKYVQRQPSPTTMIRHVYAAPPGTVGLSANAQQQLSVIQQQQQHHHPHHHLQLQAPPQQHELHQNGSGQYVLVHRANVGAADNQAPRASSAPPVPQNQHQFHGMNGIPITGRGRPASVDVDTSNTAHEIPQNLHGGANAANIVRRNISSGNITYIDNYAATSATALVDGGGNYIVATAAASAPAALHSAADPSGENTPPTTDSTNNCACSLNAMIICQQCGAFCHNDCISSNRLCVSCVIR